MEKAKLKLYSIAAAMVSGSRKGQRGATAAEYALIIAVAATAILGAMAIFSSALTGIFESFADNATITN